MGIYPDPHELSEMFPVPEGSLLDMTQECCDLSSTGEDQTLSFSHHWNSSRSYGRYGQVVGFCGGRHFRHQRLPCGTP